VTAPTATGFAITTKLHLVAHAHWVYPRSLVFSNPTRCKNDAFFKDTDQKIWIRAASCSGGTTGGHAGVVCVIREIAI